jgi:hypothetical protein
MLFPKEDINFKSKLDIDQYTTIRLCGQQKKENDFYYFWEVYGQIPGFLLDKLSDFIDII